MKKTAFSILSKQKKNKKTEVFSRYRMKKKPKQNKPTEKLIKDQTEERCFLNYGKKFSIRHGIRVLKIDTVCRFKQSPCLPKKITDQRIKERTEFGEYFYKLMINSCFGKLIQNIQNRSNLDLIDKTDTHRILNRQWKCSFDDNVAKYEKFNLYFFVEEGNQLVNHFYVGFCILEYSKLIMYTWCYNIMQPCFS